MKRASVSALHRKNTILACVLTAFAFSVAISVFIWRYSHNQPAIPQGGSYGQVYHPQPLPTPNAGE